MGNPSAREYLEQQKAQLVQSAKEIAEKAEADRRNLSGEERGKIDDLLETAKSLDVQIQEFVESEQHLKRIEDAQAIASAPPTVAPEDSRSLGEGFIRSDGYQGAKARQFGGSWTTGPVEFDGAKLTDAGLSVVSITGAGGTLPLQPQVAPMVPPVEERLRVADLFGQGTATQNSIVYLEETTTQTLLGNQPYSGQSSAATTTAEGGAKPPVFVDFTKRTTAVEKIAAFLPVSDEMLEDEPQIASYINARLSVFVQQAVEAYCVNKLLGTAGIGTADASTDIGGNNMFDAIAAGILAVETLGGFEPDAIVIHPQDFWKMSVTKDGTNGQYFSGGPYAPPFQSPWGVRTVVTREAMNGFPLVGAFREGATLWRKGGLTVEASNSHSDYFRKDLTALRAEQRLALTVIRPKAFAKVTI